MIKCMESDTLDVLKMLRWAGVYVNSSGMQGDIRLLWRERLASMIETRLRCCFLPGEPEYILESENELVSGFRDRGMLGSFMLDDVMRRMADKISPYIGGWVPPTCAEPKKGAV